MRFEHRELLSYTLLLVPALIAFFWWSWRKRRQLIAQFVQSRLLAHLTVGVSARRQKLRMVLLVAACALLMLVLARPQWGFSYEEARQRGLDVIVAVDTSRSMLAADVTPNRLARAKLATLDLKRLARTDRVGLIAFAGSAFLQSPLSFDDEAFRQNVNALDVNIIPQGGSALAEAIETARAAFERKNDNHKVLVLFTDGEDNAGEALDAAKKAAEEGMRIFTVGVGTPNGELLRINDGKGRSDYIRDDQGNVVKSRLNEKLLREIAEAANGFYMLVAGANTMDLLYERGLAPLPKAELGGRHVKRYHERYQWFLGLAIVLLLTEMFLPERKRVRRTEVTPAAVFARAALFLLLATLAASASPARGLKQYNAGQYQSALREYRNALREKTDDPRLHFNAGTSAYQAQNYEKAVEYLNSALVTPDLTLQEQAYYNRANALFRLGEATSEPKEKMEHWENAVSSYESALKLNAKDEDAKFNMEVVKQKLEELKKQQQQQDQQSKDDQKKDDKEKKDQEKKEDQKQQDQKQDQPKQDQPKQDQQQKDQQQKDQQQKDQQQQQQKEDQAKKEEQKKQQQQQQAQKGDKDQKPPQGEGNPMRAMPMTEHQAMQLLDMQKGEERPLIFIPQFKTNRSDRVLKDW